MYVFESVWDATIEVVAELSCLHRMVEQHRFCEVHFLKLLSSTATEDQGYMWHFSYVEVFWAGEILVYV